MGDTASQKTLSSKLLARWSEQGYVTGVSRGRYQFKKLAPSSVDLSYAPDAAFVSWRDVPLATSQKAYGSEH